MKKRRGEKKWISDYNTVADLISDLEVLYEFYKEGDTTAEEVAKHFEATKIKIEDLEFRNMLSDEGDNMSAVLQITAGAGGTESCDWASMLMRMYLMFAEKQGYKIKELNFLSLKNRFV